MTSTARKALTFPHHTLHHVSTRSLKMPSVVRSASLRPPADQKLVERVRREFCAMGAVLWVILLLSIFTVADRIYYTYLVLNARPIPRGRSPISKVFTRAFFWTDERTTLPYDIMPRGAAC